MKKKKILILFLCISHSLFSQEGGIPLNSEYIMDNRFILSPAWAGYSDAFQLRLALYQQWVGVKDAPSSQVFSLNGMVWNNSGLGVNIFNTQGSFYSEVRSEFSYSYSIILGSIKNEIISFGISAVFIRNSIDETKFTQSIVDPNVSRTLISFISPNFNLGVSYINENFYTSFKYDNVIPKTVKDNTNILEPRISSTFYLLAGYKYNYSYNFYIEPSMMFNYISSSSFLYFDLNSKFVYKGKNKNINYWTAISLKNSFISGISKYNPLSLNLILGLKYDNYSFGMAYSHGFSDIARLSNGSYTFSFGYDFLHWYRRKLCNCKTDKFNYN